MLPVILAAVLGAAAPEATLYTAEGGRVRGAIVEAGPAGVTMQLADGSTRRFPPSEVRKVVLADGSQWQPGDAPPAAPAPEPEPAAPPAAPAPLAAAPDPVPAPEPVAAPAPPPDPAPAPAAAPAPEHASPMLIAVERLDTLYLSGGGRVRAFVTEETRERVIVRLVDGTERRFGPGEIESIAYADGTPSSVKPRR